MVYAWSLKNSQQMSKRSMEIKLKLSHPCSKPWIISTQNSTKSLSLVHFRKGRELIKFSGLVRWMKAQPGPSGASINWTPAMMQLCVDLHRNSALNELLSGGGEKCLHKWTMVQAVSNAAKWPVPSGENVNREAEKVWIEASIWFFSVGR